MAPQRVRCARCTAPPENVQRRDAVRSGQSVVVLPRRFGGGQVAGSTKLLAAVPYRRRIRGRNWLILFPALLLAAVVGSGVFALLEAPIREGIFAWLPDWFVAPVPLDGITDYSASGCIVTLVAFGVLNRTVGPVVEELYSSLASRACHPLPTPCGARRALARRRRTHRPEHYLCLHRRRPGHQPAPLSALANKHALKNGRLWAARSALVCAV